MTSIKPSMGEKILSLSYLNFYQSDLSSPEVIKPYAWMNLILCMNSIACLKGLIIVSVFFLLYTCLTVKF